MIPARLFTLGAALLLAGCSDPIYQREKFQAEATEISISDSETSERYNWPYSSGSFLVAKPPQLAYVTSFDQPLTVPDRVNAPLVDWSDKQLHPAANTLLENIYAPFETKLGVHATIPTNTLCGPLGFDVSHDGKRMVTVEVDGNRHRLGLYNMHTGKLLGHMELPGEVGQQGVQAVRFCGKTMDFMLLSEKGTFRLSGKNGSIIASGKAPKDAVRKWIISQDSESMAMLTESGRVLGGDTRMNYFSLYNFGKEVTVPDIALNPTGTVLTTVVGDSLRMYQLQNHQIVGYKDLEKIAFDTQNVAVGSGVSTNAWANGRELAYFSTYGDGTQHQSSYEMFWRPLWVSACADSGESNWFLTIGKRLRNGAEELVMFDFGPNSRNHSVGHVLDEMPDVVRHSVLGDHLAILDSKGLRICQRRSYQTAKAVFLNRDVMRLLKEADLEQIDQVCEIIRSQKRYGKGLVPAELISAVIEDTSVFWTSWEASKSHPDLVKKLEAWHAKGSGVALTVAANRHYDLGWQARGSGYAHTITQAGGLEYEKQLKLARENSDKAIKSEFTTRLAMTTRIAVGLETDEGFDDIDKLCRNAVELAPDDSRVGIAMAFKLLPQWYGEVGDTISFALWSSKVLSGSDADLLYADSIGSAINYVPFESRESWTSYDAKRMKRGCAEWARRNLYPNDRLWANEMQIRNRVRDAETADQVLLYMMSAQAAPSNYFERFKSRFPKTKAAISRLRK